MHLTLYAGARQKRPLLATDFDDWTDVVASLDDIVSRTTEAPASASAQEQKTSLLAFAPHRLREGTTRAAVNVEAVTMMVIDVDRCNANELAARIEALGEPAYMYGSPSDDASQPDARRVRVVAPLDEPVAPEHCRQSRLAFAELLGIGPGQGVEGAHEAARIFFAGRLHGTPDRQVWRWL